MSSLRRLTVGLAGLVLLLPMAEAQSGMTIGTEWSTTSLDLPETGRADVGLTVHATVRDTNCATEQSFTVDLTLASFEKMYGASMFPPQVTFKVPPGPVVGDRRLTEQEASLNVAWNLDDAPRTGATEDYVVLIRGDDVAKSGGPCLPDVHVADHGSEPLKVMMRDRLLEREDVDCFEDPSQAKCAPTSAPPGPTPGPGSVLVLVVIAVAAVWFTRRR